ncbi:hypothetical protein TWF694_009104 [Orbilia ellipsospora]|uniref:Transcription factor Rba50 n=1 Tax=Orbilia ellipsospora TaxID=2528407 RepID=A0AAV9XDW4_9PEZI
MDHDDDIPPPAGTRFTVDLDDGDDDDRLNQEATATTTTLSGGGLIADISERQVSSASPALPPTLDASKNSGGFPAHTKRKRPSAFRQQRSAAAANAPATRNVPAPSSGSSKTDEMSSIRAENERMVASMSSHELENERQELMDSLSPELLQMFLKRATLDEPVETSRPVRPPQPTQEPTPQPPPPSASTTTSVNPPIEPPNHLKDIPESAFPPEIKVHFPQPPSTEQEPDPDPNSPEFLAHLHKKYFPNLPVDPQKLAWMLPPSESEPDPHYSPKLTSILPSSVRFDFKGHLLPPRKARQVPGHLGLHHHADSPLSAGYTIPELSHLARSSFPAQRCMAFQTLGRILFRLGIGAYSNDSDTNTNSDPPDTNTNSNGNGNEESIIGGEAGRRDNRIATDLEKGLWRCMHEGRVLESLQEAASGGKNGEGSSHLGIKNYALEALWLWQKGGGERWKAD